MPLINVHRAWLSFDSSPTKDLHGNSWTSYGNPTIGANNAISGKALQLDGSSSINTTGFALGGKDFAIDGWVYVDSTSPNKARLCSFYSQSTGYMLLTLRKNANDATKLDFWVNMYADVSQDNGYTHTSTINSVGERVHFELDYNYSAQTLTLFINGTQAAQRTSVPQFNRDTFNIYIGALSNGNQALIGSIDEFRIYDGIVLHSENFTPPTAEDYHYNALCVHKYGETRKIRLTTAKPIGKALAVRHDNQTYYAQLVPTSDSDVSDIKLFFGGETLALATTPTLQPEITAVYVDPPNITAYQGETTSATITAIADEAVTGLSYSLDGQPSWMNLSGSVILMTPTENDLGSAAVTVTARDTGSSASAATVFNADVEVIKPEILTFTTAPQNINDKQITSSGPAVITLQATGNEAVNSIKYSSPNNNVTITGNLASIKAPNSLARGAYFDVTLVAQDESGTASKAITRTANVWYQPTLSATTDRPSVVAGTSGKATLSFTYYSNHSPNTTKIWGHFPRNATVTANETLRTSTYELNGKVTIVYPKRNLPIYEYPDDIHVSQPAGDYYKTTLAKFFYYPYNEYNARDTEVFNVSPKRTTMA